MSRKIYLSTYIVEIKRKGIKEPVNLSNFANGRDLHSLMKDFILHIAKDPYSQAEVQRISRRSTLAQIKKKSLKMSSPIILEGDSEAGILYGLMRSGMSLGRKLPVDDVETGLHAYDMQGHHARMFPIYFHLQTFNNRKYSLFILERQGEFGIKKLFEAAFREFLIKENLKDYSLVISNFLVGRIFNKMLDESRITEVTFIRNIIPNDIAKFYDEGHRLVTGTTRTTYTPGRGEGLPLRSLATQLFRRNRNTPDGRKDHMVRLEGESDPFDEVDFELDVNGAKKTIHMAHTGRSLPDYDVSDNLDFDDDNEPTLDSLKNEADILIKDMISFYEPES